MKCILCLEREAVATIDRLKVCSECALRMTKKPKVKTTILFSFKEPNPLSRLLSNLRALDQGTIKVYHGDVYYDKVTNQFFQVRETKDDKILCSGFCGYYGDAKTTICIQPLTRTYLQECIKVEDMNSHPELWEYNGIGWKVKERKTNV